MRTHYLDDIDDKPLEFSSPYYTAFARNTSKGYPNNINCIWFFVASEQHSVVVRILDFDFEFQKDFLLLGNGYKATSHPEGRLTGTTKLLTMTSTEKSMWLLMKTDNTERRKGFLFNINEVLQNEKGTSNHWIWNLPELCKSVYQVFYEDFCGQLPIGPTQSFLFVFVFVFFCFCLFLFLV